ncbi:MAG: aminoacyl-tRNA hydrolase [Firmicutes bacterium]|nr:aminoacyl-tRNA hydrolase [Bacillota bacterium]
MYVIAGLGNPGKKYETTRHNMGFLVLDEFADRHGIKVTKIKHKALIGEGRIAGEKVLLVKPQTYMNLSGESLREIVSYYDVPVENLLVIYDDMDIPTGAIRIRKKGSSGSHNGMKSVIYQLQSDGFPRMRIGIGKTSGEDWKDFVTGKVSKKEADVLTETIKKAAEAVDCILEDGIDIAMNRFNTGKKPAAEESVKEAEKVEEGND